VPDAYDADMTAQQATRMMTPPMMRAWFGLSAAEDDKLDAVYRHYGVPSSGLPPTRLLAEWREAGHPEPDLWISEKIEAILEGGTS
jgi:hypothetical protein